MQQRSGFALGGVFARRNIVRISNFVPRPSHPLTAMPKIRCKEQIAYTYAKADLLNVALFGKTTKQWRDENPDEKGNIRDFATLPISVISPWLFTQGMSRLERWKNV